MRDGGTVDRVTGNGAIADWQSLGVWIIVGPDNSVSRVGGVTLKGSALEH
ncbi:hypothetical protein GCM10023156_05590 [Novipirellula rosea]|uniref:Uncharacterized protein n=1 Tax=Novipirellula rosea TaxID=1031540 RepID=A0ABP8M9L5_9BACT